MKISNKGLSIAKAKEIDIVDYLSRLGYYPAKISRQNYWYLSPFRDEKNPSFKVNRNLNRWYDFAEGKGGNLVDFGIRHNQCSVSELLHQLSGNFPVHGHPPLQKSIGNSGTEASPIKIVKEEDIHFFALVRYLHLRRIPIAIAQQYCREITYELHNKKYYAIGFKNDAGGYELRNEYFKGISSPKDITLVDKSSKEMAVFEGFFNFLSYQVIHQKLDPLLGIF